MNQIQDDLCWRENGFYFDVVLCYNNTLFFFHNRRLKDGFETREKAKNWIDDESIRKEYGIIPKPIDSKDLG